jgi:hypothetical protein
MSAGLWRVSALEGGGSVEAFVIDERACATEDWSCDDEAGN